jgi:hypothetical protein
MTSAHNTLNDCHVQEEKPEEINEEAVCLMLLCSLQTLYSAQCNLKVGKR